MSNSCRIYIAGAGAGKTTHLINEAAACATEGGRVLVATYTRACCSEIISRFETEFKGIPSAVSITTWFSFLLTNGIRPFRHPSIPERVERIVFDEGAPQTYGLGKGKHRYYCSQAGVAHSGRLSEIAIECDDYYDGDVVSRISRMYDLLLFDEAQDFNGYDYDFLKRISRHCAEVEIVGDPRQRTYQTNHSRKNNSKQGKMIGNFFDYAQLEMASVATIDQKTLNGSHRCGKAVLDVANHLYLGIYEPTLSLVEAPAVTDGIFLVEEDQTALFAEQLVPVQLRYNASNKACLDNCPVMNMGQSKGCTFDHVLIYPTKDMRDWITGKPIELLPKVKALLYVALTRAKKSVGIVVPSGYASLNDLPFWRPCS